MSSDEFTVQVKSGFDVLASGEVRVSGIKLSTLAYWHRKLPPTLVAAIDPETRMFASDWAHDAIGRGTVLEYLEAGRKTTSLRLGPLSSLDDDNAWAEIATYVRRYFMSIRLSLDHTATRGMYHMLYVHVCDVIDILVDWAIWMAYGDPVNVVDRFVDRSDDRYDEAEQNFAMLRISPGDDQPWRQSIAEPAWAIGTLGELHRGFLEGGRTEGMLGASGPLESMVQDVYRFLSSTYRMMMTTPKALPSGHVMAWGVAPAIAYGLGLSLVSLRDWSRVLRDLLYQLPEDVEIRPPGSNSDRLHRLANAAARTAPEWAAGVDRPSSPAWERYSVPE